MLIAKYNIEHSSSVGGDHLVLALVLQLIPPFRTAAVYARTTNGHASTVGMPV